MAGQPGLAQLREPHQRRDDERGCEVAALEHQWVAAAVVEIGRGAHTERADRAVRTGRYVVTASTRIEVLEVYCRRCRIPFSHRAAAGVCESVDRGAGRGRRPVPARQSHVLSPLAQQVGG